MTMPKRYRDAHRAYRLRYPGNIKKTGKALQDSMTRILRGEIG